VYETVDRKIERAPILREKKNENEIKPDKNHIQKSLFLVLGIQFGSTKISDGTITRMKR
jgi:hypothetical protein